jgi:hypothetical protein
MMVHYSLVGWLRIARAVLLPGGTIYVACGLFLVMLLGAVEIWWWLGRKT